MLAALVLATFLLIAIDIARSVKTWLPYQGLGMHFTELLNGLLSTSSVRTVVAVFVILFKYCFRQLCGRTKTLFSVNIILNNQILFVYC